MSTMKKAEMMNAIKVSAVEKLNLAGLGAVRIDSGVWALEIPVDGKTYYAKVAVSAANPTGTEKVPAFNLEAAVAAYGEKVAEQEAKAKEKAEKHAERVKADLERKAAKAAEKEAKAKEKAEKEAKKAAKTE